MFCIDSDEAHSATMGCPCCLPGPDGGGVVGENYSHLLPSWVVCGHVCNDACQRHYPNLGHGPRLYLFCHYLLPSLMHFCHAMPNNTPPTIPQLGRGTGGVSYVWWCSCQMGEFQGGRMVWSALWPWAACLPQHPILGGVPNLTCGAFIPHLPTYAMP